MTVVTSLTLLATILSALAVRNRCPVSASADVFRTSSVEVVEEWLTSSTQLLIVVWTSGRVYRRAVSAGTSIIDTISSYKMFRIIARLALVVSVVITIGVGHRSSVDAGANVFFAISVSVDVMDSIARSAEIFSVSIAFVVADRDTKVTSTNVVVAPNTFVAVDEMFERETIKALTLTV